MEELATAEYLTGLRKAALQALAHSHSLRSLAGKKKEVYAERLAALQVVTMAEARQAAGTPAAAGGAAPHHARRRNGGVNRGMMTRMRSELSAFFQTGGSPELTCEACRQPLRSVQELAGWNGNRILRVTCNRFPD